jgi:hypothetical protein
MKLFLIFILVSKCCLFLHAQKNKEIVMTPELKPGMLLSYNATKVNEFLHRDGEKSKTDSINYKINLDIKSISEESVKLKVNYTFLDEQSVFNKLLSENTALISYNFKEVNYSLINLDKLQKNIIKQLSKLESENINDSLYSKEIRLVKRNLFDTVNIKSMYNEVVHLLKNYFYELNFNSYSVDSTTNRSLTGKYAPVISKKGVFAKQTANYILQSSKVLINPDLVVSSLEKGIEGNYQAPYTNTNITFDYDTQIITSYNCVESKSIFGVGIKSIINYKLIKS